MWSCTVSFTSSYLYQRNYATDLLILNHLQIWNSWFWWEKTTTEIILMFLILLHYLMLMSSFFVLQRWNFELYLDYSIVIVTLETLWSFLGQWGAEYTCVDVYTCLYKHVCIWVIVHVYTYAYVLTIWKNMDFVQDIWRHKVV